MKSDAAPCISVFCGHRSGRDDVKYEEIAHKTGSLLGMAGFRVATGGGNGLMTTISKAACEKGATVYAIKLRHNGWKESENEYFTHEEHYDNIDERQRRLIDLADAYLILPGGLGTVYEAFEVLVKKRFNTQVRHTDPVVFLGNGYYSGIRSFLAQSHTEGFIPEDIKQLCSFYDTPEEVVAMLTKYFSSR